MKWGGVSRKSEVEIIREAWDSWKESGIENYFLDEMFVNKEEKNKILTKIFKEFMSFKSEKYSSLGFYIFPKFPIAEDKSFIFNEDEDGKEYFFESPYPDINDPGEYLKFLKMELKVIFSELFLNKENKILDMGFENNLNQNEEIQIQIYYQD